jgi:hypothetical protein
MSLDLNSDFLEMAVNVTEHTKAMLAYWDKNLICRYANKATSEWFGIVPGRMINKLHLGDVLWAL